MSIRTDIWISIYSMSTSKKRKSVCPYVFLRIQGAGIRMDIWISIFSMSIFFKKKENPYVHT